MASVALRKATQADLPLVYTLFREAIDDMNACGIAQWDELYPTSAILLADWECGELYVGETDAGVIGAVVLNEQCDPQYANGAWQGNGPYVIVHRLCIAPSAQGAGIGRGLMQSVELWAKEHGYTEIRLDAFSQNPHALRMYDRLGYTKRGEANWRKGLFYLMEKPLDTLAKQDE